MLEQFFRPNFRQHLRAVRFGTYQHGRKRSIPMIRFSQRHFGFCVLAALLTMKAWAFEIVPIPATTGHSVFRLEPLQTIGLAGAEAVAADMSEPVRETSGAWVRQNVGPLLALPSLRLIPGTLRAITSTETDTPTAYVLLQEGSAVAEAFRVSGRGISAEVTDASARFARSAPRMFAQDFRAYLLDPSLKTEPSIVRTTFRWPEVPPRTPGPETRAGCAPSFASFGVRNSFADSEWAYLYVAKAASPVSESAACAWPAPLPDRVPLHLGYYLPQSQTLVLYGWGARPVFAVVAIKDGTPIRSSAPLRRISEAEWIRNRDAILSERRDAHEQCAPHIAASSAAEQRSLAAACLLALQFETYR